MAKKGNAISFEGVSGRSLYWRDAETGTLTPLNEPGEFRDAETKVGDTLVWRSASGAVPVFPPAGGEEPSVPTLGALTLNGTLTQGVVATDVTITGALVDETITLGGANAGLTVQGPGTTTRTVSGTPIASGALTATQSSPTASNSPRGPNNLGNVAASGVVAGKLPTSFAGLTPTVQYHAHTSPITLAPAGTFQGYMVAGSNKLTVTSFDSATCPPLRDELVVTGPDVPAGATIAKAWTKSGGTPGGGQTGEYEMSFTPGANIGSSGSPATFTVIQDRVVTLGDLMGNGDLSAYNNASGPILMTDDEGVKCLLFNGGVGSNNFAAWLRNLTLGGLDASNMSWFIVGRFLTQPRSTLSAIQGNNLLFCGAKELNNYNASYGGFLASQNGMIVPSRDYCADPSFKRMFLGTQKQVFGKVRVTDDGVNGANTSSSIRSTRVYTNTDYIDMGTAGESGVRGTNITGFSFNSTSNTVGGGGAILVVYEIIGFLTGQMGNRTQMPARADAAVAAMTVNHDIPDIEKSLIIAGDSRLSYGGSGSYSNWLADGSGRQVANFMTDPGGPFSVPKNVRVLNYAFPGLGIDALNAMMESTGAASNFNTPSPLASIHMLGGGNDYLIAMMGSNDFGRWPDSSWGGLQATGTSAYGDDIYAGGYSATFVGTASNNSTTISLASVAGLIGRGSVIQPANGWVASGVVTMSPGNESNPPTSVVNHNYQSPAQSAVAGSALMRGYKQTAQALVARGFNVAWLSETYSGAVLGTPATQLSARILTDLETDTAGGPGAVTAYDPSLIQVAGQRVLGPQWQGASGPYYGDLIHFSTAGLRVLFSGGDTPEHGMGHIAQQLLAT